MTLKIHPLFFSRALETDEGKCMCTIDSLWLARFYFHVDIMS